MSGVERLPASLRLEMHCNMLLSLVAHGLPVCVGRLYLGGSINRSSTVCTYLHTYKHTYIYTNLHTCNYAKQVVSKVSKRMLLKPCACDNFKMYFLYISVAGDWTACVPVQCCHSF